MAEEEAEEEEQSFSDGPLALGDDVKKTKTGGRLVVWSFEFWRANRNARTEEKREPTWKTRPPPEGPITHPPS